MALSIGLKVPLKILCPKNQILSLNKFILVADTTNPLCLITLTNISKCFQWSSIDLENIKDIIYINN